jgi:hypothetical protein
MQRRRFQCWFGLEALFLMCLLPCAQVMASRPIEVPDGPSLRPIATERAWATAGTADNPESVGASLRNNEIYSGERSE